MRRSILERAFYLRDDVTTIAKELIGKTISVVDGSSLVRARIIETEAYAGVNDKASHAYGSKRTKRTEVMYSEGGVAYVYLCYGLHVMLNVVTNSIDVPHAVLIRGVSIIEGLELVAKRRGMVTDHKDWMSGPGKVTQGLGITMNDNGNDLCDGRIRIEEGDMSNEYTVFTGPRIGIAYAEEDALLPYRFVMKNNE